MARVQVSLEENGKTPHVHMYTVLLHEVGVSLSEPLKCSTFGGCGVVWCCVRHVLRLRLQLSDVSQSLKHFTLHLDL